MSPPFLVQFKHEHHRPGLDHELRSFLLVSKTDTHGVIRHAPYGQDTAEADLGEPEEVPLERLRYAHANAQTKALEQAVRRGHNRIVHTLLENDRLLDANGSRHRSLVDVVGVLPEKMARRMIGVLRSHGADLDHQAFGDDHGPHWTPFWNAVHDNNLPHAQMLAELGARFDLDQPHPTQSAYYTVVHLAASCGAAEMMMWLMAQPQCPAVANEDLLHELRARCDTVDPNSYEPEWGDGRVTVPLLHLAAAGRVDNLDLARQFVDWLLDNGEQWEAVDHNQETAWQVAQRLDSEMRPIFDAKLAQSQAVVLDAHTPAAAKATRKIRM